MTHDRAAFLAFNAANRRAADDYYARQASNYKPPRKKRDKKTHCKHGHPFDETNTRLTPQGSQVCRTCDRAIAKRQRARKKNAA